MGRSRLELQALLEEFAENVYAQPPENTKIEYPCIVYNLDNGDTKYADNSPYRFLKRYSVTLIDQDPDTTILDQIAALPSCTLNRAFPADGLNHFVFTLYF